MNLMRAVADNLHDKAQLIASHSGHKKPFEISVKMIVKRHEGKPFLCRNKIRQKAVIMTKPSRHQQQAALITTERMVTVPGSGQP